MALAAIVGWQDYAYTRRALASDLEAKPLGMMAYFWHGNKTCTATNKSCIFGRCRALSFYPHLGRPEGSDVPHDIWTRVQTSVPTYTSLHVFARVRTAAGSDLEAYRQDPSDRVGLQPEDSRYAPQGRCRASTLSCLATAIHVSWCSMLRVIRFSADRHCAKEHLSSERCWLVCCHRWHDVRWGRAVARQWLIVTL